MQKRAGVRGAVSPASRERGSADEARSKPIALRWILLGALLLGPGLSGLIGLVRRVEGPAPLRGEAVAPNDPPPPPGRTETRPAPLVAGARPPSTERRLAPEGSTSEPPTHRTAAALDAADPAPGAPHATPRGRIGVLVLDALRRRPVPHATLEVQSDRGGPTPVTATVGADGSLVLDVPPGASRIVALSERSAAEPRVVEVAAGAIERVTLLLEPTRTVAGRIVDATDGSPIEGARIAFWTFAELDQVRTGPDGVFEHPRFPATGLAEQVRVEAPGYGPTVRYVQFDASGNWSFLSALDGDLEPSGGAGAAWVEIALVPETVVVGELVDPWNRPIAGARVSIEGHYRVLASVASRDEAAGTTDESGRFRLDGLRSDIGHGLLVRAEGFAERRIELPRGPSFDLGPLVLEPERIVSGVVLDPSGLPVADIAVEISAVDPATPLSTTPPDDAEDSNEGGTSDLDVAVRVDGAQRIRTGPDGVFLFEGLGAGAHRLRVLRDSSALAEELVLAEDGSDLTLHLPPESLTLHGVVRDGRGRALEGIQVRVQRYGLVGHATTDADGRFQVAGVDDQASYQLVASRPASGRSVLANAWAYETARLRIDER